MLEELRIKHYLNHSEMAKKIGVSTAYYSQIESGKKNPSFNFLTKLKKVFKEEVDLNTFFEKEKDPLGR